MTAAQHLTCQELVELLTDYFEDVLEPPERARFDSHLRDSGPCRAYLSQMRTTIDLLGRLTPADIDPATERTLLLRLRAWKTEPEAGR